MESEKYWLRVDDIFTSIQGESTDAGKLCTFLRLYGCNVGCSFCDQKQDPKNLRRISSERVLTEITKRRVRNVCITGGEPLMQWGALLPVILELVSLNYNVSVETSGCYRIDIDNYNRKYKYVMDVKCPSSGVSNKNILDNLLALHCRDEVKFVISNREDYDYAVKVIRRYPTQATLLFSPCFDESGKPMIGQELIDWLLKDHLYNIRRQIQMHKCLGVK